MKLTPIEMMILKAVNSRPNDWLNCSGAYIGEVLALQAKGAITSRLTGNQLQVRLGLKCQRCGELLDNGTYCDDCLALSNNEFYGHFAALHLSERLNQCQIH